MVQMLGWFSAEAARASRRKRSRTTPSLEVIRQEFERDKPSEKRVLCLVDHAHATAADLFQPTVMGDVCFAHWAIFANIQKSRSSDSAVVSGVVHRREHSRWCLQRLITVWS